MQSHMECNERENETKWGQQGFSRAGNSARRVKKLSNFFKMMVGNRPYLLFSVICGHGPHGTPTKVAVVQKCTYFTSLAQ